MSPPIELTESEQHDVLVRSPLDEAGVLLYTTRREAGRSHQGALCDALNDFRLRENGMNWEHYWRVCGAANRRQA
jgi:hypothetical protein